MSERKQNMTQETKEKISISKKNITQETREKLSISRKGTKHSEETKIKMSESQKIRYSKNPKGETTEETKMRI